MSDFRIFEENDIRKAISMAQAIELMKEAFVQISKKSAKVPVRMALDQIDQKGRVLFMPAYSPNYHLFGLKMVSVFPDNTKMNLPAIQGKMLVIDDENGTPKGLIDAEYLTALRTGAASGLATDLLARQNAKVLAIFGTGAQAHTQVEAILCVRKIEHILVYATTSEKSQDFCKAIIDTYHVACSPGVLENLKTADIICTATTSQKPLFEMEHIGRGVHINGIGSYKPEIREIPSSVIANSILIVDHRESALSEAGDIIIPVHEKKIGPEHIYAELGELVSGSKSGRTREDQITVFKSVGNAVQDLALASSLL